MDTHSDNQILLNEIKSLKTKNLFLQKKRDEYKQLLISNNLLQEETRFRKNDRVGDYKLLKTLGKGGNGHVWEVEDKSKNRFAMKILKRNDEKSFSRFKSECNTLSENTDIAGIIPIGDKNLPEENSGISWYIMPIAKRFDEWLEEKPISDIIDGMIDLVETLNTLHSRKIYHRDIKPANILFYKNKLCFSDFGLVKSEDSEDVTVKKEDVGPKYTMAPEMRRNAYLADSSKADVYSMLKTIWISIVGDPLCFDGQYNSYSYLSIDPYCKDIYTKPINDLLVECTENDPTKRPSISQVRERLQLWRKTQDNFSKRNMSEWFDFQNLLFPRQLPSSVTWTTIEDIVSVLDLLSSYQSLHHMFVPGGGGDNIIGASLADENGLIALKHCENGFSYLKPLKLTFESFGSDPVWNYFRLESMPIKPVLKDKYPDDYYFEDLAVLNQYQYISKVYYDIGEFNGEPLPRDTKVVSRYLHGTFVFFNIYSFYNNLKGDLDAYNGRHNTLSESEFRDHISFLSKKLTKMEPRDWR